MYHPIRTLFLEILRNNKIVFPALALLFGLGAWMISELMHLIQAGLPQNYTDVVAVIAFLASLWIVYASLTLMENQSGWRMHSMTTRWFVLPVKTWVLVAVPQLMGILLLALVLGAWWCLLLKNIPFMVYVTALVGLSAAMSLMQAASWATSRKPWQFWGLMAVLAYLVLYQFIVHVDEKDFIQKLEPFILKCAIVMLSGWCVSYVLAILTRCGVWPGYFSFSRMRVPALWKRQIPLQILTGDSALFWSETFPILRFFVLFWIGLVALVFCFIWFSHRSTNITQHGFHFILLFSYNLLPVLGLICLAPISIAVGCVTPGIFKTRMSPFLATQPITAGMIGRAKLMGIFLTWALIWLPFLLFGPLYQTFQNNPGDLVASSKIYSAIGWFMVISAHVAIGALPVFFMGAFGRSSSFVFSVTSELGVYLVVLGSASWLGKLPANLIVFGNFARNQSNDCFGVARL